MTNPPGWASPGSPDSPGPDSGDSSDPAPDTATTDAGPADADPAPETTGNAEAAAPAPGTAVPPQSGAWSPQQPPAGEWHPPSATTAPVQPPPPSQGQGHPTGGWGRQWAPPPPPPQEGGPGWGPTAPQPAGWHPGYVYTARPQAPQPGVVPLRPLDAGDILNGALAILRQHWRTAVLLVAGVALLTESINALVTGYLIDDTRLDDLNHNPDPSVSDILHAFSGTAAASALVVLTTMIGVILASGLLTTVVSRAVLGRRTDVRSVWREIRPRFPQLLGLAVLLPVALLAFLAVLALPGVLIAVAGAEAGGAALASLGLIAGMVVCVWQWNLWSLTAPALLLEKQSIKAALKRSVKLVSGSWWRVFGVQLLIAVITAVASFVVQLPFSIISAAAGGGAGSLFSTSTDVSTTTLVITAIGSVVSALVTLPISAGAVSLLYVDQRIRREGLDVELARAAKIPGYEATSPSSAPAGH